MIALRTQLEAKTHKRVRLNILEIRQPELDAVLVGRSIAEQLEKRVSFRRAMKQAVQKAMRANAKGIKIIVGGRLGGAEIARSEKEVEGKVPLHTLRADIDYGLSEAHTTFGVIGIKVWIYKGDILPSKRREPGEIAEAPTQPAFPREGGDRRDRRGGERSGGDRGDGRAPWWGSTARGSRSAPTGRSGREEGIAVHARREIVHREIAAHVHREIDRKGIERRVHRGIAHREIERRRRGSPAGGSSARPQGDRPQGDARHHVRRVEHQCDRKGIERHVHRESGRHVLSAPRGRLEESRRRLLQRRLLCR